MEASVHVVDAAGDLVLVRHDSEEEGSRIRYDRLTYGSHPQSISAEPVCAIMGLIILAVTARQKKVVRITCISAPRSFHNWILEVLVKIG